MNHISGWLLALPFLAGAVLPLQAGINGQLARQLSSVFAAALIYTQFFAYYERLDGVETVTVAGVPVVFLALVAVLLVVAAINIITSSMRDPETTVGEPAPETSAPATPMNTDVEPDRNANDSTATTMQAAPMA